MPQGGPPDHAGKPRGGRGPSEGRGKGPRSDRNVDYTKKVQVPKRSVDPFGGREQAKRIALQRATLPRRPNVTRFEQDVQDKGDHYEVTIRGIRGSGPAAVDLGSEMGQQQRSPQANKALRNAPGLGFGFELEDEELTPFGFSGRDIPGRLASQMSPSELRQEANRRGFSLSSYGSLDALASEFAEKDPYRARQLVGML